MGNVIKPKKIRPKADDQSNNDDDENMGDSVGDNMSSPKGMPQTFQGRLKKIRTKSKG